MRFEVVMGLRPGAGGSNSKGNCSFFRLRLAVSRRPAPDILLSAVVAAAAAAAASVTSQARLRSERPRLGTLAAPRAEIRAIIYPSQ